MHDTNQFVYVIFGGAGGIGSSVTKILTNLGHKVIVASRDKNKHLQLKENINVDTKVVDAVNFSEVKACLQNIYEEYGRIDGIVNCIGSILLKPAHLTTEQEWQQTLLTNLGTAFAIVFNYDMNCTRHNISPSAATIIFVRCKLKILIKYLGAKFFQLNTELSLHTNFFNGFL